MNSEYLCSHFVVHFQCLWLFGLMSGMCQDGLNRTQFYSIHSSLRGGKILISGHDEMRKNQTLSVYVCAHNASGHGIGCQAVRHHIYIYSNKHTSACEEIKISPSSLSEGGSLRSPIIFQDYTHISNEKAEVMHM